MDGERDTDVLTGLENGHIAKGRSMAEMSGFILTAKIITIIVTGLALVAVTRILGPAEYGLYILATAVAGFFGAFQDFGVSYSILKFVAQHVATKKVKSAKSVMFNGTVVALALSGIATIISLIASQPIAVYVLHNPADTFPLQVAAFIIVTSVAYNIAYAMLIALGKGRNFAIITALQALIQGVLSVILAVMGFGALSPIIGMEVSFTFGFLASLYSVRKNEKAGAPVAPLSSKMMNKLLKFSAPLGFSNGIHTIIDNFGAIVLAALATTAIVGNYGVTIKVATIFDIIIGSIGLALLPLFASTITGKLKGRVNLSKYFNYSLYSSILFVSPAIFYVVVLAKQFSFVVFSGVYSLAPGYIMIMSVGTLISIAATYTNTLITSAGKTRKVMKYTVILSLVSLLLMPILIPTLNGLGLVLIIYGSEPILGSVLAINYAQKHMGITLDYGRLSRVIAAGIISALLILPLKFALGSYYIPLLIAAAIEQILLYPIALVLIGGVTAKDITVIRKLTSSLPLIRNAVGTLASYTSLFLPLRKGT